MTQCQHWRGHLPASHSSYFNKLSNWSTSQPINYTNPSPWTTNSALHNGSCAVPQPMNPLTLRLNHWVSQQRRGFSRGAQIKKQGKSTLLIMILLETGGKCITVPFYIRVLSRCLSTLPPPPPTPTCHSRTVQSQHTNRLTLISFSIFVRT